jgi:hypothetical protein
MVNAWESLAKAKILKDNNNKLSSLWIVERQVPLRYKKKKNTGVKFTIDVTTALGRCNPPAVVIANVGHLVAIRDELTHLPLVSKALPTLVFNLGSATLKSYAQLTREWFGTKLSQYDFMILPIGFSYPFATIDSIDIDREPEAVATLVRQVIEDQGRDLDKGGHHLVCEIRAELVSAKKFNGSTDLSVRVAADDSEEQSFRVNKRTTHDSYPYEWTEAFAKVKLRVPHITATMFNRYIKEHNIKTDPRYSVYSYRSLRLQKKGPTKTTASLYNKDFVELVVAHFSL